MIGGRGVRGRGGIAAALVGTELLPRIHWIIWFIPGALLGALFGWFLIQPINRGLGWFFGIFGSLPEM